MNGLPGQSLWQEARAADGRVYYYHTQTKATQWTKPLEMMAPAEVSLHRWRIQATSCYVMLIVVA
jgi:pre-mRNA-processing factor 40